MCTQHIVDLVGLVCVPRVLMAIPSMAWLCMPSCVMLSHKAVILSASWQPDSPFCSRVSFAPVAQGKEGDDGPTMLSIKFMVAAFAQIADFLSRGAWSMCEKS